MSHPKRTTPESYGAPALRLDEQTFKVRGLAAYLCRSGLAAGSPFALRALTRRLNSAAIAYWANFGLAAAPTARMQAKVILDLERASRKIAVLLSARKPGDWQDPDDPSPGVSPELVKLLEQPLDRAMRERVERARHCTKGYDTTITEVELFGTYDPADMLRLVREATAVLAQAAMDVSQSDQFDEPDDVDRPDLALIENLRGIYEGVFRQEAKRTIDRISGEPTGPWFHFVFHCCRTIGITAPPQTIDGWLRGR